MATTDRSPLGDVLDLARLEESRWPAMLAELRRSGVPLNEGGEQAPAAPAEGETQGGDEGAPTAPADGAENPDAVRNAIKAEREARKKAEREARELRDQIAAAEQAGKTEGEQVADRLKALEDRAAEAERRAVLAETAQKTGLPVDVLTGPSSTDPEDLEAYAERLKQLSDVTKPAGATPASDGGARPRPAPKGLGDQIAEAEKAQDWATARRLKAERLQELGRN